MAKLIVVTGRGGSGKTSFAALATKYLPRPQLLIDADSDQNLAAMLGVDLEAAGIQTISGVLHDIQVSRRSGNGDLNSMPLAEQIEYLLHLNALYESSDFDLLSIGVKWTPGCYCHPNDVLRRILPELANSYPCTVVDSPGGLEHLNRRITTNIDDIFVIMDPSGKSLRNVQRLTSIAEEIGINYQNIYLVANHRFNPAQTETLSNIAGTTYLGHIPADPQVEQYDWTGKSLLDLPESAPAPAAVAKILAKAGY